MILYYYDTGAYCLTLKIVIKFIIYADTRTPSPETGEKTSDISLDFCRPPFTSLQFDTIL